MNIIDFINTLAVKYPWLSLTIVIYLLVVKLIVGVRDAIDKTPASDDNWFEKASSILGKTIGYLAGFRPKQ